MSELNESDYNAFQEDIAYLVNALKESFEATEVRYHEDEINDTLYIELEGLADYSETEIGEIAGPLLEELDLDFDEIILLPIS